MGIKAPSNSLKPLACQALPEDALHNGGCFGIRLKLGPGSRSILDFYSDITIRGSAAVAEAPAGVLPHPS